MIKSLLMGAALAVSSAAIAQTAEPSMPMPNGSMDNGVGTPPSTDMNNHASHAAAGGDSPMGAMDHTAMTPPSTDMNNHASHAAAASPNVAKCAARYPSYDPATGMYVTSRGRKKACAL